MAHLIAELQCVCGLGALGHHAYCPRRSEGEYVGTFNDLVVVRSTLKARAIKGRLRPIVAKLIENHNDPRAARGHSPVLLLLPSDAARLRAEPVDAVKPSANAAAAAVCCPDCSGSGQYVGLGFNPAEDCKRCSGSGRVSSTPVAGAVDPKWLSSPDGIQKLLDTLKAANQPIALVPSGPLLAPTAPWLASPIPAPTLTPFNPYAPSAPPNWPPDIPWPGNAPSPAVRLGTAIHMAIERELRARKP